MKEAFFNFRLQTLATLVSFKQLSNNEVSWELLKTKMTLIKLTIYFPTNFAAKACAQEKTKP